MTEQAPTNIRLSKITINNLLNRFDYEINLNQESGITILTAPNGFGKSTILKLVQSIMIGAYSDVASIPFKSAELKFGKSATLRVTRPSRKSPVGGDELTVKLSGAFGTKTHKVRSTLPDSGFNRHLNFIATEIADVIPHLRQVGPRLWRDEVRGAHLDTREVIEQYGSVVGFELPDSEEPEEIQALRRSLPVLYVPADRLYLPTDEARQRALRDSGRNKREWAVHDIDTSIRNQVRDATRAYGATAQRIDRAFVSTVLPELKESKEPTQEELSEFDQLKAKVNSLEERFQRLGLLAEGNRNPIDEKFDSSATFTILRRHYMDVAQKLRELEPLAERMELLRQILNDSYSFKSVDFDDQVGIRITSQEGTRLGLQSLSSGEQHLLVLFGRLLFRDKSPHILLDEPEISLHLAWQEKFLDYLEQVFKLEPFDLLIATHSPSLIKGRWEMTCELLEQAG
jgi:predicted ATPase